MTIVNDFTYNKCNDCLKLILNFLSIQRIVMQHLSPSLLSLSSGFLGEIFSAINKTGVLSARRGGPSSNNLGIMLPQSWNNLVFQG